MADVEVDVAAAGAPKKRTFKKFSFRGVDLDALLDMSTDELVKLFTARARRRFQRGLKRKPMALIKKLRKAKFMMLCVTIICYFVTLWLVLLLNYFIDIRLIYVNSATKCIVCWILVCLNLNISPFDIDGISQVTLRKQRSLFIHLVG
ncbi:putative ribosomal protein S19/S15 [Helianthus anomalus]